MRILSMFGLCLACFASQAQQLHMDMPRQTVPIFVVGEVEGKSGEADEQFLLHAGSEFTNYTDATGFEACSQLCHAPDGRPGLLITTNRSHIGCVVVDRCPRGMLPSGLSVHSHPQKLDYRVNASDAVFLRVWRPTQAVQLKDRQTLTGRVGFSRQDYGWGPGYLVDGGWLHYQEGRQSEKVIGRVVVPRL